MYTQHTYQDWEKTPENERNELILKIIREYSASQEFKDMLTAQNYMRGDNETIAKKVILQAGKFEQKGENGETKIGFRDKEIVGNRVANNFFMKFVVQENMRLLSYGVTTEAEYKQKLGKDFDKQLAIAGEHALCQGVCWAFYNLDHVEIIQAAKDSSSGMVALVDEMTGAPRVAIQFWRLSDDRPMYIRLFEENGTSILRTDDHNNLVEVQPRSYYRQTKRTDDFGVWYLYGENWPFLPIVPLYGNPEHRSELTNSLREKIDAYDVIMSDLCDNLERANSVFWVLNNFGGSSAEAARMVEEINRLKLVMNQSDGVSGGSTAEPRTIEVPYQARKMAIDALEKAMYSEYMAVNMSEIAGSSLTNVAIQAATSDSNLKTDRYEWMVFDFVHRLLLLNGIETDEISFKRSNITNEYETIQAIYTCRDDIDRRTALQKNPLIQDDEIEGILENIAAEVHTGAQSMDELQKMIDQMNGKDGTGND